MSGHSKWNNIKRKKEKTDGAKAKVFTKIGREISVAVRTGGPNPASNSKLADLIAKAKRMSVPNDNIQRIIKKAEGGDKTEYEAITYEGYGPGGIAVMVVMPLYYGLAGLLADVMLVFTITMLMAGLAAFGATLTLPGIAGIVLTIGMSVDANVLIFERIREEIRQGLKPLEAVAVGFDRATISIVDSNLTTIIAAAILYQFGTGPVRGFAVTLSLGIVASMFTAIFVSRTAFGLWLGGNDGKKLSI